MSVLQGVEGVNLNINPPLIMEFQPLQLILINKDLVQEQKNKNATIQSLRHNKNLQKITNKLSASY